MVENQANLGSSGIRYGLRGVLLVVLIFSLITGAYRYGYENGRRDGPVIPTSLDYNRIYQREYDVGDLVTSATANGGSTAAITFLMEHLTKWAAPSTWDLHGGFATITAGGEQTILYAENSFRGHAAVLENLSRIRSHWKRSRSKDLNYVLRDLVEPELEHELR